MVRHNKDGFLAQAQPLAFHSGGNHFKGFACAYFVCQQGIAAVQYMGNGVFLMLPQGDFGVHAGEYDMASVILAGAGAVHFLVVLAHQRFTALRVFPNPILERILDKLLLLRRKGGFLGIEYAPFPSVCILYGVIDTDVAEI